MENNYPKYQYSVFLKNGKDAQVVVRSDKFDEFKALIAEIDQEFAHRYDNRAEKPAKTAIPSSQEDCPICHNSVWINEGTGKNGLPYKNKRCTKNKEHVVWWDFELDGWRGL